MGQAGDYHLSVSRRLYSLESSLQAVSPARSARQGRKPQLQSVKIVPSVKRSQVARALHLGQTTHQLGKMPFL
jgi:hypothetical protein